VDLWSAACHDARDQRYVLNEATRNGYSQGGGEEAVNGQLRALLRSLLVRLGRGSLGRLSTAERANHLLVSHVGALVKEVELEALRVSVGSRSDKALSAMNGLATLHKGNGDLGLAETLYVECLATRRQMLGNSHPTTLISINNLGTLFFERGKMADAETLLAEVLASRRRELGPLAPETLKSLNKLGVLQRAKGDLGQAVTTLGQALEGRRTSLGGAHPDTLRTLNDLGNALYDKGVENAKLATLDAAAGLYKEALTACKLTLGERHPLTLTSMNNLGNVLHARGLMQPKFIPGRGPNKKREEEMERGAALLRESLAASTAVHGHRHLETLISASNLGSALRSLGGEKASLGDEGGATISDEAAGLITDAVEGIADAWTTDLERRPQMRDALRAGLEDVIVPEPKADGANGGGGGGPFAFLLGLLAGAPAERETASSPLSREVAGTW